MNEQRWREQEKAYLSSPFHRHLGLTLHVEAAGQAAVMLKPVPWAANRNGTVAGGIIATMMDSAVCQAVKTQLEPHLLVWTLDLTVNFVRPAGITSNLLVRASVDNVGRSIAVGTGRAVTPDGILIALGLITVAVRAPRTEES